MQLKTLKTEKDYLKSLERFEEIFQAKPNTVESEEADAHTILIKEYEDKHLIINKPFYK